MERILFFQCPGPGIDTLEQIRDWLKVNYPESSYDIDYTIIAELMELTGENVYFDPETKKYFTSSEFQLE